MGKTKERDKDSRKPKRDKKGKWHEVFSYEEVGINENEPSY